MKSLKRILSVAIFVGLLVFGWQFASRNGQPVAVDFLFTVIESRPGWQVLLGTFMAGVVLMGLVMLFMSIRSGLLARRYRKTIAELEAEVHHLRNLPLAVENLTGEPTAGELPAELGEAGRGA